MLRRLCKAGPARLGRHGARPSRQVQASLKIGAYLYPHLFCGDVGCAPGLKAPSSVENPVRLGSRQALKPAVRSDALGAQPPEWSAEQPAPAGLTPQEGLEPRSYAAPRCIAPLVGKGKQDWGPGDERLPCDLYRHSRPTVLVHPGGKVCDRYFAAPPRGIEHTFCRGMHAPTVLVHPGGKYATDISPLHREESSILSVVVCTPNCTSASRREVCDRYFAAPPRGNRAYFLSWYARPNCTRATK